MKFESFAHFLDVKIAEADTPSTAAKFGPKKSYLRLLNLQNSGKPTIAEKIQLLQLSAIAGFYSIIIFLPNSQLILFPSTDQPRLLQSTLLV